MLHYNFLALHSKPNLKNKKNNKRQTKREILARKRKGGVKRIGMHDIRNNRSNHNTNKCKAQTNTHGVTIHGHVSCFFVSSLKYRQALFWPAYI